MLRVPEIRLQSKTVVYACTLYYANRLLLEFILNKFYIKP